MLLLLSLSSPAVAESHTSRAPTAGETWTLLLSTHASQERAPQVQRARAALLAARAFRAHSTMGKLGNPVLSARAMIGRPDGPAATYGLLLGLPFDFSGKRAAYRDEANWLERQAEAELDVAKNDARSAALRAYVEVAIGEAQLRTLRLNQETAADFLNRVRARFDARAATALDLALSERDYAESVANFARANISLAEARRAFRQALDLDPESALTLAPLDAPTLPAGIDRSNVAALALSHRREAHAIAASASRKRVAAQRQRREAIAPWVVAAEGEQQGRDQPNRSVGASLSTELPFILKNQGERAVTLGEAGVLDVEQSLTERQVAREAYAGFERLEAVLDELRAIDTLAMPAAERALSMTNEMLEAGAVDVFRVLTARQAAFELRVRRVEVLREAWELRVQLERAIGFVEELQ
ncbi:MAG: hypothetical protein RL385_5008 [Pseudomonadota bacterium]